MLLRTKESLSTTTRIFIFGTHSILAGREHLKDKKTKLRNITRMNIQYLSCHRGSVNSCTKNNVTGQTVQLQEPTLNLKTAVTRTFDPATGKM